MNTRNVITILMSILAIYLTSWLTNIAQASDLTFTTVKSVGLDARYSDKFIFIEFNTRLSNNACVRNNMIAIPVDDDGFNQHTIRQLSIAKETGKGVFIIGGGQCVATFNGQSVENVVAAKIL